MNGAVVNTSVADAVHLMDTVPSATRRTHVARGQTHHRTHLVWIAIGFGALAFGALLYAVVRPHAAMFLPTGWHHPSLTSPWSPPASGVIGSAPTFLHAIAMSFLICAAVRVATPNGFGRCCAAVCGVELAFEFAQHSAIAAVLLGFSSSAPAATGPVAALRAYLTRGTFDPLDLVAACAGCLAAFTVLACSAHDRQLSTGARHVTA